MVPEINQFLEHEIRHRRLFETEIARRGVRRCRSYHLCGLGGLALGTITGLLGARAIALTTEAVESVVLEHLKQQLSTLQSTDPAAAEIVAQIVTEEQEHHDASARRLTQPRKIDRVLTPIVRAATESVIWMGFWRPGAFRRTSS